MQAILKSEHQRFQNRFQEIIQKQGILDSDLVIMDNELESQYSAYEQKMNEIRKLITHYEETKQKIRNKIKLNLKYKQHLI